MHIGANYRMSSITIHGLDELEAKLGRLASIQVLKPPMHKSTGLIRTEARKYLSPSRKPMIWKSREHRIKFLRGMYGGFFRVPYQRRRSGGLAGAWIEKVQLRGKTLVGIVSNNKSYGPYVQHPTKQAAYHRGNWRTTDDIVKDVAKPVQTIFEKAIRQAIND